VVSPDECVSNSEFPISSFPFPISSFHFPVSRAMAQSPDRPKTHPVKILFVCFGNACRSQMAEALANHLGRDSVQALSAGAHPLGWIPSETRDVLDEKGISLEGHRSKGLKDVPLSEIDIVVEMEAGVVGTLPEIFKGRIIEWDIPDPFSGDVEVFRAVRDLIVEHVNALLAELCQPRGNPRRDLPAPAGPGVRPGARRD
jgi:arsenate reductase (thioredoxin)